MCRLIRRMWNWLLRPEPHEHIPPIHINSRRVPEAEVIRGRCWCGDQVLADTPRGWIDAVMLHYRERHPEDEAGQRLAEDPNRFSRDAKFQPKQW